MRIQKPHLVCVILVLVCLLGVALPVSVAQTGGGLDLSWTTIDGGGVINSTGGTFQLSGTIGQPDASTALIGGNYVLVGGFWTGIEPFQRLYLPVTMK